ncbi:membrane protein, partial [Sesbania bispinosa]
KHTDKGRSENSPMLATIKVTVASNLAAKPSRRIVLPQPRYRSRRTMTKVGDKEGFLKLKYEGKS